MTGADAELGALAQALRHASAVAHVVDDGPMPGLGMVPARVPLGAPAGAPSAIPALSLGM
jgi:hypothetical protein